MEIDRILRVNARLEIRKASSSRFFLARIAEVNVREFAITTLYGGPGSEVLPSGEKVECSLADNDGQAQYGFECLVLRRESRGVPLYYLSKPEQVIRLQRRGFVRVQVLLSTDYQLIDEQGWNRAYLIDLSGGGAKLSHYEELAPNQRVLLSFKLNTAEPSLFVEGKIVRSIPVTTAVGTLYHSGVEFLDISMSMQDSIVAFVFGRLLETRRTREGRA